MQRVRPTVMKLGSKPRPFNPRERQVINYLSARAGSKLKAEHCSRCPATISSNCGGCDEYAHCTGYKLKDRAALVL